MKRSQHNARGRFARLRCGCRPDPVLWGRRAERAVVSVDRAHQSGRRRRSAREDEDSKVDEQREQDGREHPLPGAARRVPPLLGGPKDAREDATAGARDCEAHAPRVPTGARIPTGAGGARCVSWIRRELAPGPT